MDNGIALWLAMGASLLAVIYGIFRARWIIKQPAGNEKMQEITAGLPIPPGMKLPF